MVSSCLPRYPACLPTPSQKCQGNHECPLCPSRERDPLLQGAGFLWWTLQQFSREQTPSARTFWTSGQPDPGGLLSRICEADASGNC